jgi:hypothetical protein
MERVSGQEMPSEPTWVPGQLIRAINLQDGGDWTRSTDVSNWFAPCPHIFVLGALLSTMQFDDDGDLPNCGADLDAMAREESDESGFLPDEFAIHLKHVYLSFAGGERVSLYEIALDMNRWPLEQGFITDPGDQEGPAHAIYRTADGCIWTMIETELEIQVEEMPWIHRQPNWQRSTFACVGNLADDFSTVNSALQERSKEHGVANSAIVLSVHFADDEMLRYLHGGCSVVAARNERQWQLLQEAARRYPRPIFCPVWAVDLDKVRVLDLLDQPRP